MHLEAYLNELYEEKDVRLLNRKKLLLT